MDALAGALTPDGEPDEEENCQRGYAARESDDPHGHRSVLGDRGIIAEAVEEHLVDDVADLAGGSLDQGQANVFRGVLDPVIVLSQPAIGGGHDDTARMSVFVGLGLIGEVETGDAGDPGDRFFATGQEMPAVLGAFLAVAVQGGELGFSGLARPLFGIDRNQHHVVFLADVEFENA